QSTSGKDIVVAQFIGREGPDKSGNYEEFLGSGII
ncbi:unnamed protein product, partial [marine sediment metagenome]